MAVTPKAFRVTSAAELETQINAFLLPFSGGASRRLLAVNISMLGSTPFFQKNIYADLSTDTVGASAMSSPYQFITFSAPTEAQVEALCSAFIAANPTFFFSQILTVYRPEEPDPVKGVILGIFFSQDSANGAANWGFPVAAGAVSFINPAPSTVSVGGFPAGSTFPVAQSMQQMWNGLLYPFIAPTFDAFSISGESTSQEVGDQIPAAVTFLWNTTNPANVQPNTILIRDITTPAVLASGLADDGSQAVLMPGPVSLGAPGSYVFRIEGTDLQAALFTRTLTFTWFFRRYAGNQAAATLTEAQIEALALNALASGYAGTYATGAGGFKYICFADSVGGQINSVKDSETLLNVPFATVADNPAYSNVDGGGFSFALVSVTNAFGITDNYRVYRTQNALGAAITLIVT